MTVQPASVGEALAMLKDRPDDAELYQQLGELYFQQQDIMHAWEAFMQSLRLNPDDPWTCLKFGTLLTICDDKHYARTLFDRAIELEPKLSVAHWCSADLHRRQGEYELAERGVDVDPANEQALDKLAEWRSFAESIRHTSPDAESGSRAGFPAQPPHHVACGSALRGSTKGSKFGPEGFQRE